MQKILLLLLFSTYLFSQTHFVVTKLNETYTPLSGALTVSTVSPWSSFTPFTVPLGFTFNFFGTTYSTIYVEGSGFTRFDALYYYLAQPFAVQMQDAGDSISLSPIKYKLEGSAPNRVCKIEWNNCVLTNDIGLSSISFQMWLYEGSNIIECRYGNISYTDAASAFSGNSGNGPVVGMFNLQSIPNKATVVQDSPPSETYDQLNTSIPSIFDVSMNGIPTMNTVYRFTPYSISNVEENAQPTFLIQNPIQDIININVDYSSFNLIDMQGKTVLETTNNQPLQTSHLASGIYIAKIEFEGKTYFQKIIK